MIQEWKTKLALFKEQLIGAVRSKTIWLNGMFLLLLDQLPNLLTQLAYALPQIQPYVGDTVLYHNATLFLIAGNVYLRFRTKTPLEQK